MSIVLDMIKWDDSEMYRWGTCDLDTFQSMDTVIMISGYPWDTKLSLLDRISPAYVAPPNNLHWQDFVLLGMDNLAKLMIRDHHMGAVANIPVTIGQTTYLWEVRYAPRKTADVTVVETPIEPVVDETPESEYKESPLVYQAKKSQNGKTRRR